MNIVDYASVCSQSYDTTPGGTAKYPWTGGIISNNITALVTLIAGDPVIVLPGSKTPIDWIRDVSALPVYDKQLGWCHDGFHQGMSGLFKSLVKYARDLPISITGHSLGGARARILAGYFLASGYKVKNLITFGAPKPAYDQLKDIISKSGCTHLSYKNGSDIVPELPLTIPPVFNYVHTEDYILIDGGPPLHPLPNSIEDHHIELYIRGLQNVKKS
jgi:hypothetical protein